MEVLYYWDEAEAVLVAGVCATNINILVWDGEKTEGTVQIKDYFEHGIEGEEKWFAVLAGNSWIVSKLAAAGDEVLFVDCDTLEPQFTLCRSVNEALKAFIAVHLEAYLAGKKFNPPPLYCGPMNEYKGPCLCAQLVLSSAAAPFDWEKHTEGGMFPSKCFECSCTARWYCVDPDSARWLKVAEVDLWHMLVKYNGVATKQLGILGQEVFFLATLVEHNCLLI